MFVRKLCVLFLSLITLACTTTNISDVTVTKSDDPTITATDVRVQEDTSASEPKPEPKPEPDPWAQSRPCVLGNYSYSGLHPKAEQILADIDLTHRITQGLNNKVAGGNVHGVDTTHEGKEVTAAIDISVRCLSDSDIKKLLDTLASRNIIGWLRRKGQDHWPGPDHIHAVWVGDQLKQRLKLQVESWLLGKNGLASDKPYQFWSPSEDDATRIRSVYSALTHD